MIVFRILYCSPFSLIFVAMLILSGLVTGILLLCREFRKVQISWLPNLPFLILSTGAFSLHCGILWLYMMRVMSFKWESCSGMDMLKQTALMMFAGGTIWLLSLELLRRRKPQVVHHKFLKITEYHTGLVNHVVTASYRALFGGLISLFISTNTVDSYGQGLIIGWGAGVVLGTLFPGKKVMFGIIFGGIFSVVIGFYLGFFREGHGTIGFAGMLSMGILFPLAGTMQLFLGQLVFSVAHPFVILCRYRTILCETCFRYTDPFASRYEHGRRYCEHCQHELEDTHIVGKIQLVFGETLQGQIGERIFTLTNPDFERAVYGIEISDVYLDPQTADPRLFEKFITYVSMYPPQRGTASIHIRYNGDLQALGSNLKNAIYNTFAVVEPLYE